MTIRKKTIDMDAFIRKTKDVSLQKSIDYIQYEIERAKVIGIGEESHGETVSWVWRYAIINRLIHLGYKVIVMCEQNDYKNSMVMFRSGNFGLDRRVKNIFHLL